MAAKLAVYYEMSFVARCMLILKIQQYFDEARHDANPLTVPKFYQNINSWPAIVIMLRLFNRPTTKAITV